MALYSTAVADITRSGRFIRYIGRLALVGSGSVYRCSTTYISIGIQQSYDYKSGVLTWPFPAVAVPTDLRQN